MGEGQPRPPVGRDDRSGHGRVACGGLTRTRRPTSRTSQRVALTVPDPLINVSNGRLRSTKKNANGTTTYEWFVVNPINNYAIAVAAGNYAHYTETFDGEKGKLTMDFWPLDYNVDEREAAVPAGADDAQVLRALVRPVPVVRGRLQAARGA